MQEMAARNRADCLVVGRAEQSIVELTCVRIQTVDFLSHVLYILHPIVAFRSLQVCTTVYILGMSAY